MTETGFVINRLADDSGVLKVQLNNTKDTAAAQCRPSVGLYYVPHLPVLPLCTVTNCLYQYKIKSQPQEEWPSTAMFSSV